MRRQRAAHHAVIHRALRQCHRLRWLLGDALRQLHGFSAYVRIGHYTRDNADALGLSGIHHAPCPQQLQRARYAHYARQKPGAAVAGDHAHVDIALGKG